MKLHAFFIAVPLVFAAACGDDGNAPKDAPTAIDAGGTADASCFTNPKTYNEIINACTDSVKVYKDSKPPLLNPDGTVPALP
jgi:hypothetical protein